MGNIGKVVTVIVALVGVVFWFQLKGQVFPVRTPKELNPQYDYIVVGAGTAGSVVAARLSEDPDISVLLLEAGGDASSFPHSHIPGAVPFLQGTDLDWAYSTVPQDHACRGMHNQTSKWPRGKGLGGTSLLNYMLHVRGDRWDYEGWEEGGAEGWGWSSVLPAFKALEETLFQRDGEPDFMRGYSGPIGCSAAPSTPLGDAFLKAASEDGFPILEDYNSESTEGFARAQYSTRKGTRESTLRTYLWPARGRNNLHVVTGAHVTKVNLDEEKRAVGVDYLWDGKLRRVLVNYEVILSLGALASPQLLMLSGIGPEKHLKEHNIFVVSDSPAVGQNLKDHIFVNLAYKVSPDPSLAPLQTPPSPLSALSAAWDYLFYGTGILSWPMVEVIGFGKSTYSDSNILDLQYYMFPVDTLMGGYFGYLVNFKDEVTKANVEMMSSSGLTLGAALLQPSSVGQLLLQSPDPLTPVSIQPRYLSDPKDAKVLVDGLKTLRNLVASQGMKEMGVEVAEGVVPGCEGSGEMWSDEYLMCLVRTRTLTLYHPVGTARMGKDPVDSVVDSILRVHGVRGLRVVDASVFPSPVSGNPSIPTIMVAERAAQFIKADTNSFR